MDLYQQIRQDHREIRTAIKPLDDDSRPVRTREKDFLKLWRIIMPHQMAEEKVLYSPLMEHEDSKRVANEAIEEHRVARTVLRELDQMTPGGDQWTARVTVLRELLEHHFKQEEGDVFSQAEAIFKDKDVQRMGKEFAAEKKRIAPSQQPESAAAHSGKR